MLILGVLINTFLQNIQNNNEFILLTAKLNESWYL